MTVWRIRMRNGSLKDKTAEVWTRGEVGVWYGGWSAEDFDRARQQTQQPWEFLTQCDNHRRSHSWKVPVSFYQITLRLASISADDWVLVVVGQTLHLGRLESSLAAGLGSVPSPSGRGVG